MVAKGIAASDLDDGTVPIYGPIVFSALHGPFKFRWRVFVALGSVWWGGPALFGAGFALPPQKPNIIFILADDLGYGEVGCYHQQRIKTPNLDKMAAEGMRFTQCYAGTTVCAPSRA